MTLLNRLAIATLGSSYSVILKFETGAGSIAFINTNSGSDSSKELFDEEELSSSLLDDDDDATFFSSTISCLSETTVRLRLSGLAMILG